MKRITLALCMLPAFVSAAPFDLLLQQKNIADSATFTRVASLQTPGVSNLLATDPFTNYPRMVTLGQPFGIFNGQLEVSLRWDQILNAPILSPVATSGDYNDLNNKPSLSQVNADWDALTGPAQILGKPTTLSGYGITDAYPSTGNPSGFLTGITSGQVAGALGFTPYSSANPSAFVNQAGARSAVTLTTTGTAGAATYNSTTGALNIPNYAPGTGTVTSVTAGAGLSGGAITTSGTISMPSIGTAGSYSGVTTDAQGRVTAGTNRSQAAASRALNSAFQVSATRDAIVSYSVQLTVTASITGGQNGDVVLEISTDSGFTTGVQTVAIAGLGQTYTLAIALAGVQPQTGVVSGVVPAGYYARMRTVNNTGTPTYAVRAGQETLL